MASSATATATPTPLLPPPPGQTSNFANPESLAFLSNIVTGICVSLVTIFFAARCYVRIFVKRSWILEDWLALVGWVGTVAFCALMVVTMAHHGGQHGWDITAAQAQEAAYWFNVVAIEYGVTICITKIAVLWLYRRVFATKRWGKFNITIIVLTAILVAFYTAITLAKIFQCTPRAKIANKKLPGSCINLSMLLNTSGLFNTITDFIILFLPIQAVWRLKMKKTKKLIVCLVFTFGSCLVGFVVRLQISGLPDTTWNQPDILLWGAAELTTGLLCVCFPEMGALFRSRNKNKSYAEAYGSGNGGGDTYGPRNDTLRSRGGVGGDPYGGPAVCSCRPGTGTALRHDAAKMHGRDPGSDSEGDCYHDQMYVPLYEVGVAQSADRRIHREPNGVHVKQDFTVESHLR